MPNQMTDVQDSIITFFTETPSPNDDMVHGLATQLGLDPHILENEIYNLLSSYINDVGKHDHMTDEEFDANELAMGIEVELEHTDNRSIAKSIAKDHLEEVPDYYTRLKAMEEEAGVTSSVKRAVKNARVAAEKEVTVMVKTQDLLDYLIGDIRYFYRNGLFFEHDEGIASIDGRDLLDVTLEQLVGDFKIGDSKTKIMMNPQDIHEYMSGSGYRSMDYTTEDAIEEFKDDPLGILSGMQSAFNVSVDPYAYARQTEYWEEENESEEYLDEDYEDSPFS